MIRLANAPCSWGVIENTPGVRGGYVQVLDEIRATGYDGTELGDWGFMPTDPDRLADELAARGLALIASWVSVRLYDPAWLGAGIEGALRTARLLAAVGGGDALIVLGDDHSTVPLRHDLSGRIRPEHALEPERFARYVEGAERVARAVRDETGLRTVFHHHGATYIETPAEIDRFLEMSDPEVIGLCFDTGHYTLGGGDAVEGVRRHADRIGHVHLKDCEPALIARADDEGWGYQQLIGQGLFSELGQGVVDFPAVLEALREQGYDGWLVVEQDVLPGMGRPRDSAARNRAYLEEIGL